MSIRLVVFLSAIALATVAAPAHATGGTHGSGSHGASAGRTRARPRMSANRSHGATPHTRNGGAGGPWLGDGYAVVVPLDDDAPLDDVPAPPARMPDEKTVLWGRTGNPCFGCHWGDDTEVAPPVAAPPRTPRMKIIEVQPLPRPPKAAPASHHRALPATATVTA